MLGASWNMKRSCRSEECSRRCFFATKGAGETLKTSPSFDFSFFDQMKAMHAEIHLQRVCEMVAMILVVNPAIHLVAQTHAKQPLGRQRCGPQFGSWREGG